MTARLKSGWKKTTSFVKEHRKAIIATTLILGAGALGFGVAGLMVWAAADAVAVGGGIGLVGYYGGIAAAGAAGTGTSIGVGLGIRRLW